MRNTEDLFGIRLLQEKLLEIAQYFHNFCEEHQIEYCLSGGTALGAIRHNGFIPWDDDIDIFMTKTNYTKFVTLAKIHLDSDKYVLQEKNTSDCRYFFSKIRAKNTTLLQEVYDPCTHNGIYIDLFVLNYVSNNVILRKIQYFCGWVLKRGILKKIGVKPKSKRGWLDVNLCSFLLKVFTVDFFMKIMESSDKGVKPTNFMGCFVGVENYKHGVYPAHLFSNLVPLKFENINLYMLQDQNADIYLKIKYGDNYMEIPKEAELNRHAMIWDVNLDYTNYL